MKEVNSKDTPDFETVQTDGPLGSKINYRLSEIPDTCPSCHKKIKPEFISLYKTHTYPELFTFLKCTNKKCNSAIVAEYEYTKVNLTTKNPAGHIDIYTYLHTRPVKPFPIQFSDEILKLSPSFVSIFNQANASETFRLNDISGMGYRKSLEFLIKDYLIKILRKNSNQIEKKHLGKCIEEDIDDLNIRESSKLAAWLGNDETHFYRKFEDKDIEDLKILIRITVNWIESHLLMTKYKSEMIK